MEWLEMYRFSWMEVKCLSMQADLVYLSVLILAWVSPMMDIVQCLSLYLQITGIYMLKNIFSNVCKTFNNHLSFDLLLFIHTVGKHVDFVETSMEIQMMSSAPRLEWWSPLQLSLGQLGKWRATTPAVMGVAPPVHSVPMSFLLELSVMWFKQPMDH